MWNAGKTMTTFISRTFPLYFLLQFLTKTKQEHLPTVTARYSYTVMSHVEHNTST